jgi:hypothetical protein
MMLVLCLVGFLLRVYRLDGQSYWIDEAWTLFYADLSLPALLENLRTIRSAPPLYHLLTIYWVQWAGNGEYALRFLSVVSSVLAIPLIYRLGRLLAGPRLGLLAAGLLAIAPYQIWHAQDARNYSMLTAASLLSMWAFIALWRRGGWGWWLVYVLGTEWALLTHYHALIIIGVQGLFFLITWRRHWPHYLAWAGTLLVILAPLLSWLTLGSTLWRSQHWLPQVGLWDSYLRSTIAYSVGELVPRPLAGYLSLAFVALYGLGLWWAGRRRWQGWAGWELSALLLSYTLAPNLAAWLYSQYKTSVYLERYLIFVQTGFVLAIALALLALLDAPKTERHWWLRRSGGVLALLLLSGLSLWVLSHHYTDPAYAKPDWRGIVRTIEQHSLPGDAILMTGDGGEKLFAFYYHGDLPVYHDFNTPVPPPDEARRLIKTITGRHRRLWYTPYGVAIDGVLEGWLAENSYPAWQQWLGRKRLALYATQPELNRRESLQTHFADGQGHGPTLLSLKLPAEPVPAGDLLALALTWQTDHPLNRDYQLSLRLSNTLGDIFSQSDWPPLTAVGPTSSWPPGQPIVDQRSLWLPADLPPGPYVLQLVVYDPANGAALGSAGLIQDLIVAPALIAPPPAALAVPNLRDEALGPVALAGYAAPDKIQPGQPVWLWLYWQARQPMTASPQLRLTLADGSQQLNQASPLADSVGPLAGWQPGQLRRAVYHLPTSPNLSGETATLTVTVLTADGRIAGQTELAPLRLEHRPRSFAPVQPGHPLSIGLGRPPSLTLRGYDLSGQAVRPGDSLPVTLYWQAEAEMAVNYTVFLQLLDPAQHVVAQVDRQPLAGAAPTTTWLPGEVLTDLYHLSLPAELPPGQYQLIAGMYHSAGGQRLPTTLGGDFISLAPLTVE